MGVKVNGMQQHSEFWEERSETQLAAIQSSCGV